VLTRNKPPQLELPDPIPIAAPDDLDARTRERIDGVLDDGEDLILVAHADLGADGRFGEQWLAVTSSHVLVFGPEVEGDGAPTKIVSMEDIEGAGVEMQVGCGILQVTMAGQPLDVIQYSHSQAAAFNKLSRAIDDLAKDGKEIDVPKLIQPDEDEKICEKCGRVLPPWSPNCPACVPRGRILRRLYGYLRPHIGIALLALAITFVGTGITLIGPQITRVMVDHVLAPKDDTVYYSWPPAEKLKLLGTLILLQIGLHLTGTVLRMAHGWIMIWLGGRITFDVRSQLYQRMQHLALKFFDKKDTGGLMSRITRDSDAIHQMIGEGSEILIRDGLLVVGIGVVLLVMDWKLALCIMIPVPIIVIVTASFWRKLHRMYHRIWHRWSKLFSRINEAISGVRVVKAFAQEEREVDSVNTRAYQLFVANVKADRVWAIYFPAVELMFMLVMVSIWWFGGRSIILGTGFTLGALQAFIQYMFRFFGPLQSLTRLNDRLTRSFTAAERVFEVIDTEPEGYDNPDAVKDERLKGHVDIKDVSFGYDKAQLVLRNVSIEVQPGEMIGLVGHSGAGKSTLINLVCRFYDVDDGEILIDGVPIKDISLHNLRSQIGVVLQESFLFNGTIAENIAYGKPGATVEEIIGAARAANAHEFIIRLPDGYDTKVGERGARVSGGERQRISIARAILHDPAILILDEATASVDTETEKQIQEAISRLIAGRTTFAIAHRLSTLRNADRLLVLEHGKVSELGTHDELLEQRGTYHKLVEMQREVSAIKAVDG